MTASNPFLRLVEAGSEVVAASVKYGEKVFVSVSGRERAEIESELRQAKAVGQFTMLMASAKAKNALNDLMGHEHVAPEVSPVTDDNLQEPVVDAEPPTCIDDYDALTASQIVALLSELSREEREHVLTYESANRNRKSILKELSRLA
ncbi:unannotated protein [freshwater metagenome]|uniref:Unannotated protein n=1 Tax=freshwater metagenome TaxID=449393 RepID=A0A6J7CKI8_9ZZZZ|nr:hypothetical protein [Actinomycetota bacterium]MUH57631.1 hypothetical protein [Actinomycetota bacterium]